MTETTGLPPAPDAPPAWPPPPPHSDPTPPWPRRPIAAHLVRSSSDRMLAGVAGGVARRLGIDPLILRLLLVVLAFFYGAGILLYAVGWLLLPLDDGRGRSLIEDGFDARVPGRTRNLFTVACLVVVIGVFGLWVLSGQLVPALLLIATVVAVFLYARRDTGTPAGAYAYRDAGPAPSPYGVGSGAPDPAGSWPQPPVPADPRQSDSASEPTVAFAGGPPTPPPFGAPVESSPPPPPVPTRQRREPSYLGPLTISVATVGLGVLAAVDAAWADLPGATYIFLTLAVVALGLVIGAWYGRSRGLIVLGILLCAALVPATALDTATDDDWSQLSRWNDGETVRVAPLTPDEIQPTYDIGSGRLVLDLREIDFTGADVATSLVMGAGEVLVLVPEDVNVIATGTVDLGELELLATRSGGVDADADVSDLGGAGTAGGEFHLMIDVNVGRAEVRREAA